MRVATTLLFMVALIAVGAEPKIDWAELAPTFTLPTPLPDGPTYRSMLTFDDGSKVKSAADWPKRRQEIYERWMKDLGPWPAVVENPKVETIESTLRENFIQHKIRFKYTPTDETEAYLLVPQDDQPARPAVVVLFYEPETAIGLGKPMRDFAYRLVKRGFVTLSVGNKPGTDNQTYGLFLPSIKDSTTQPLSMMAHAAANCYWVLANRPEVDPRRIGVTGHSYGGKWAMFASCLYDRFAAAAWSDPGIVFDEARPSVNYWESYYLGYEPGNWRKRGVLTPESPRIGAYKRLMEQGRDLHELHALMAPRPFLVSGGSEDKPTRWRALAPTVEVNELLDVGPRVGMTNRPAHDPTPESNEAIDRFFEIALQKPPR